MSDQMDRLGHMVDEALAQAGTEQELANAPASAPENESRTSSGELYTPRMLGGGTLHQAIEDICWIYRDRHAEW
jgi:hypothetical protein